jgi:hypothetical protein
VADAVIEAFKGFNLGLRVFSRGSTKQNVVVSLAIEWWVQIDKVYTIVLQVRPENFKIVTIIKMVDHFPSQRMPEYEKPVTLF